MAVGSSITYATLIASKSTDGSISNWLNHDSVTASADTIVADAEAWIYRDLRHWRMLTSTTGTFTLNAPGTSNVIDFIALPADYLEDKLLYITGTQFTRMVRKPIEEVISLYGYDGNGFRIPQQPYYYFNDQTNLKFDAPPDQTYPYLLYYYQQLASLATSSTNFLTQFYPRLLRSACCLMAAEFMKDAGQGNYDRTYWEQQAGMELAKAQAESDHSVRSQDIGMILQ
jgi:hypothetical protein